MSALSEKAQEALQALYRAYVENLPQKVDEVEHLWSRAVTQASIDLVVLHEMHRAVHSLSGSGATYGCVALSEAFAHLEDMLQMILDHHRPTPQDREAVTGLLARLKDLALAEQDHLYTAQTDTRPRPPHSDRPAHASLTMRPIVWLSTIQRAYGDGCVWASKTADFTSSKPPMENRHGNRPCSTSPA